MINSSEGGMGLYHYPVPALDLAEDVKKLGAEVVLYWAREENLKSPYVKGFMTCVTVAKDFLGIKKFWVLTPGQLFNEVSYG
jgi:hypothetical protein